MIAIIFIIPISLIVGFVLTLWGLFNDKYAIGLVGFAIIIIVMFTFAFFGIAIRS